jgi:four helix bundle protein
MKTNPNQSFTDLEVWKSARRFKNKMWTLVKTFPQEEKYKLSDQIIRSSRSIGAMIAEGHGRFTYKDQIHYCIMAKGSLAETLNHLIDAMDSSYITKEELANYKLDIDEAGKLLNGYISYLKKANNEQSK